VDRVEVHMPGLIREISGLVCLISIQCNMYSDFDSPASGLALFYGHFIKYRYEVQMMATHSVRVDFQGPLSVRSFYFLFSCLQLDIEEFIWTCFFVG
jgi:hypothetical protein